MQSGWRYCAAAQYMADEYELAEREVAERQTMTLDDADDERDHYTELTLVAPKRALDRLVVWKLDFLLLPFVSLLFLVNSLDRSNVGNAETSNFTQDIGVNPDNLNTAIALFFGFFVALQPVGASVGRKYGMVPVVPVCMLIWGVCTTLHIFITGKWQLYTLRIIIGILEGYHSCTPIHGMSTDARLAGFYPTTVSYLSLFYTRFEFARRLGFFYGQSAVAGAIGGLLSYWVILKFPPSDGDGATSHWKAWQILFLIEGGLTICIAFAGFFWLPHGPRSAWFLSESERTWAQDRVVRDRGAKMVAEGETKQASNIHRTRGESQTALQNADTEEHASLLLTRSFSGTPRNMASDSGLTRHDVVAAIMEWKIWYLLIMNVLSAIPASAFGVFLPLVMRGFGVSPSRANLLTAPAFMSGVLVLFLFTYWSDSRRTRILPILVGLAVLLLGLGGVVVLPRAATMARYVALCVMLGGTYVASPLTVAWLAGNVESPGKRAVVLGINGWGNLAGVFSSLLFRPRFAPDYLVPFYVTLACVSVSWVGFGALRLILVRENLRRKRILAHWTAEDIEEERVSGLGPLETDTLAHRIMALVGVDAIKGRQGEERMTFIYGL